MACEATINWGDAVTWGLVLAGWIVVRTFELSHERRKEKRDATNLVIDEIKSVEHMAIAFHRSEIFNAEKSESLTWRVGRLNRSLQRPPLKTLGVPLALMVRFKKELILVNTDASTFVTQPFHGSLINGIRYITDEMVETIEAARDKKFK